MNFKQGAAENGKDEGKKKGKKVAGDSGGRAEVRPYRIEAKHIRVR